MAGYSNDQKGIKRIQVFFYCNAGGTEPVRSWLKALDADDRRILGQDLATLEYGWPIGMPVCRPMGQGLFELRSNLIRGRIARVLFCTSADRLVLLHGFIKKSQKTPKSELDLANGRMKECVR